MIQLSVLNYLLNSKDSSFILLNNLNKDYFSDYPEEFSYITEHYEHYGNIPDKVSFLDKFPEFPIIEVNETSTYLIDSLIEDYNKRHLVEIFNGIAKCLQKGDVNKALELYNNSQEKLITAHHLECVDITTDISRYDKYLEKCNDFDKYYITTGFKELDDIFGGWDRKEELATIIARTNQGKSWILLKTASAAAEKGLTVGIYSGEMSEDKVGYRIDTLSSHISNSGMTHGDINIQLSYKGYLDKIKEKFPGAIKILTPAMISGPAGVNALKAFIEKENLDMLCVDQHSLLEDDRKAKNPVEKAANISRDLKNLQVMKKIPIITVSQQNRNSTESGIDASHIAQSDRIGQDSTIILAMEQKDGVMRIYLIKSRDSQVGKKLEYAIDLDKGIFTYMPSIQDAAGGISSEDLKAEFEEDDIF